MHILKGPPPSLCKFLVYLETKRHVTILYLCFILRLKRKWKPPKKKNLSPQPSVSSQEEVDNYAEMRSRIDNHKRRKNNPQFANNENHGELLNNDEELALQLLR